jgi:transposase-like protein
MSLKPLNAATCPKCRSKNTCRGGYVKEHRGSAWKCHDCGVEFIIPTMVLKKVEASTEETSTP